MSRLPGLPFMNLVKIEPPANHKKVLVRLQSSEGEMVKEGFNTASNLREAGYVVEVDLGRWELADFRWLLDINKGPLFVLTDQFKQKRFELKTVNEAVNILGEKDADKDSLT